MRCNDFDKCSAINNDQCLNGNSECLKHGGYDKIVVCKEHGKKYILDNNIGQRFVQKYHIDGSPLIDNAQNKCDYLLVVHNCLKVLVFVELKGTDVGHAAKQIVFTYGELKNQISNAKLYARIIHKGTAPRAYSNRWYDEMVKIFGLKNIKKHENDYSEKVEQLV